MGDYDVTSKHLIAGGPRDWLTLAGLPVPADPALVRAVDADLSTITTAPDQLIRVDDPADPYVAHVEFQSWADPRFDDRVLVYNALARQRHRLPVRSVAYLLRPDAVTRGTTGRVHEHRGDDAHLSFGYHLVRVWQVPVDTVLAGGLGSLPLAPVSAVAEADVPAVIDRMRHRIDRDAPPALARELWASTEIFLGLRFDESVVRLLVKGVIGMQESTVYQDIRRRGQIEGRVEGQVEGHVKGLIDGERAVLVRIGTRKFGPPGPVALARLTALADPAELGRLAERVFDVNSWDKLLGS